MMSEIILFYLSIPFALVLAFILALVAVYSGSNVALFLALFGLPLGLLVYTAVWRSKINEKDRAESPDYNGVDGPYNNDKLKR